MELFEGASYRINIEGMDSTLILNSYRGIIKANLVDADDVILVDYENKTFTGTLVGNVVNEIGTVLVDTEGKIFHGDLVGSVIDMFGNHVYNAENGNLEVENVTARDSIYGNLRGNLINSRGEVVFDFLNNYLYLDSITTVGDNFLIKSFNEYNQEIVFQDSKIGFSSTKTYNFNTPITSDFYSTFDYDQITVLSNNVIGNKNSAGILGFYGFTNQTDLDNNDTKFFGSIGFIANYTNDSTDTIPADFIILNGKASYNFESYDTAYDYIKDNCLVFDHRGVLSVPVAKVGAYQQNTDIVNPEKGMIIFNDAVGKFQGYTGTAWVDLH